MEHLVKSVLRVVPIVCAVSVAFGSAACRTMSSAASSSEIESATAQGVSAAASVAPLGNSLTMRFWKEPGLVYTARGPLNSRSIDAAYNIDWVFQGNTGNGIVRYRKSGPVQPGSEGMDFQFQKGSKVCNGLARQTFADSYRGDMTCWDGIRSSVEMQFPQSSVDFTYSWPNAQGPVRAHGPVSSYRAKLSYQVTWRNEQNETANGIFNIDQDQIGVMNFKLSFNGRECNGSANLRGSSYEGLMTCNNRTYTVSIQ